MAGGNFKEKAGSLSLINQHIMVDDMGSHYQAMFSDIFAGYQNPPLTGDAAMAIKAWQIWKSAPFSCWQCQVSFALWCGVLYEAHLQAEKHPLHASLYAFTSTIRPGACLRSWASHPQGINLILGMRTHIIRRPTSGFALTLGYRQIRTGVRSWTTGVKALDLGVPS